MKPLAKVGLHFALVAVAAVGSVWIWTREKASEATTAAAADIVVWPGRAAEVQRLQFENKSRKITLEARRDSAGRYFEGTLEKDQGASGDAGTPGRTSTQIVSVKAAERIAERIAPLRAVRNLGKVSEDKYGEFGLVTAPGTFSATLGGRVQTLLVGGTAPGGTERYVKVQETGEIAAVPGDFLRDLEAGEASLNERDLHGFEDADLRGARLSTAQKSREILRQGPEGKRYWADPASADKPEDTVVSWMTKIDRLRPSEYLTQPPGNLQSVVKVDYKGRGADIGFLEIAKAPGAEGKAEYFLRTERTRRYAKVPSSLAEPVEQDLSSVLR